MKQFILKFTAFIIGILSVASVISIPAHAQHIVAGKYHSLYQDKAGNVWVWGNSGLDSVTNEKIPQLAMKEAKAIFASSDGIITYVIKQDGSLWGWGASSFGELGVKRGGNSRFVGEPRQVTKNMSYVSGSYTVFGLKPDHTLWVWGGIGKQRGDKGTKEFTKPVKVINDVAQVSASFSHTLVLKKDGTLLAWGSNQCGALGIGNTKDHVKPVRVNVKALGKRKIAKIFARNGDSFIIADDGSVWNWGEPGLTYPYCHDEPRLTPVRLNIDNVKDIALGFRNEIFLKKDGTVWELSIDMENRDAPAYWKKLMDNVSEIAAGDEHYLVLKNDGTVWAWGNNQFGQIGDGTDRNANDPVQVHFPEQ